MAHLHHHAIVSIAFAVVIAYLTDISNALLFFAGGFFIDVDHLWWYMLFKKEFSFNPKQFIAIIKRAYWFHIKEDMREYNVINIFHTIEMWIFCIIISAFIAPMQYFVAGLLIHMAMDFGYAYYHNATHEATRCHSLLRKYLIIKEQNKKISLYNLLT